MSVETAVLDPASLLLNRKAKQRNTDRIDARKMVRAGPAEVVAEQVVRLQMGERPGARAFPVAQDPRHRKSGVVVQHLNPAEEGEGADMAVQKRLRRLPRIRLDEPDIGMRQDQAEEGNLLAKAPTPTTVSPKSTWAWPGG